MSGKMKKILITGGSSYIVGHTIPFLKSEGYEVDNYDITNDPNDDFFDKERLTERMKGKDVVYHLASIPHPFKGNEADYKRMNYEGSKIVFECAKNAGVKKFIFPSSGCVYGFWGVMQSRISYQYLKTITNHLLRKGKHYMATLNLLLKNILKKKVKRQR